MAIQAKLEEAKEEAIDFSEIDDKLQGLRDDIDRVDDVIQAVKEDVGDVTSLEEADVLLEEVFSELRHEEDMENSKKCVMGIAENEFLHGDLT